jgi:predicted Zn-dependent protease with MMP-like domain
MLTDKEFQSFIAEAIDSIPAPFSDHIDNVAFIVEDEPSDEQRRRLKLYPNETLFGLYEGVPLPQRGGSTKLLPDIITIFKNPIIFAYKNKDDIKLQVAKTIWHEVAHYYGLDHQRIHQLENKAIRSN